MENSELSHLLQSKLDEANEIMQQCSSLHNVGGMIKLRRKIKAELNFLIKLQKGSISLKKEHLKCSNLIYFRALVDTLSSLPDVTAVLQPFPFKDDSRIVVDIVAGGGNLWVKVIARKPDALHRISLGQCEFGEKSIVDHALEYLSCAKANPNFFTVPSIRFVFCNGVPSQLAKQLEDMGVIVVGETVTVSESECSLDDSESDYENDEPPENRDDNSESADCSWNKVLQVPNNVPLNLDVTTMLAYVSSLTNGNCWFKFKEKVLSYQAERERVAPVKIILDRLFEERDLLCCQTAADDFDNIVYTLGGPSERERSKELMKRVRIIPDCISERTEFLQASSQIKFRSKIIFGTGDSAQAITTTANIGFVRSAQSQGVKLAVFVHESRALTEAKEITAEVVPKCTGIEKDV